MSLAGRIFRFPSERPDPDDVSVDLPVGDVFDMLKNERRQWVLRTVAQADEDAVSLRTLSRRLTAHELDVEESAVRSDDKKARYVGLYQSHLPRLDETGLIDFENERAVVFATPRTSQAVAFLDVCESMVEGHE